MCGGGGASTPGRCLARLGRAALLESPSWGPASCASPVVPLRPSNRGTSAMIDITMGSKSSPFPAACRRNGDRNMPSSCTSSWAWMGSTRRVASRAGPLRRPSSNHEARAARPYHWESPSEGASRKESGRAGEVYRTSGASDGSSRNRVAGGIECSAGLILVRKKDCR